MDAASVTPSPSAPRTRLYLVPGMFGFARLAGLEYMEHLERALAERFQARGRAIEMYVVDVHPSASVRRRASDLARLLDETCGDDDGPIHLLGHSLGGLDVRLVASPGAQLLDRPPGGERPWHGRLRSATTLNSPHYGSPGGAFFATSQGQRILYAVSAITLVSLRLGSPPLAITSALVATLGRIRERAGIEVRLIERLIEMLERTLDEDSRREIRHWLARVRDDQGGIVQLAPEAMDLFDAGVVNAPHVRYQCVAAYAPDRWARPELRDLGRPWVPLSGVVFRFLHRIAAAESARYPCAPPDGGEGKLRAALGHVPPPGANDGMVPLRSQLWGDLVWVGQGDHLDVIGYFDDPPEHRDWLTSGSGFDRTRFAHMMDAVVDGMVAGEGG